MMYPFGTATGFPRNRWYIAAYATELSTTPIQRTLLDVPVALYRSEAGQPIAMYGICPHRYYPLALGKVEGDALVCGYHGFTFAGNGKCVRIPSQGTGAGFVQPTYRLEERGTLVWIWMGDQDRADPDLIPPYADFGLDQPGWQVSGCTILPLKSRGQLLVDNLMDLTHLPNIHHQIPGGDAFYQARHIVQERPRSLRLIHEMNTPWTDWHAYLWGAENRYEGVRPSHSLTDFYGPELIRTSGPQMAETAEDGSYSYPLGEIYFMHGVTPETAHSTHYFAFQTRNVHLDDAEFARVLSDTDTYVRGQDVAALEAVEQVVEDGAQRQKELLSKADRAAMQVRDRIHAMILAEA